MPDSPSWPERSYAGRFAIDAVASEPIAPAVRRRVAPHLSIFQSIHLKEPIVMNYFSIEKDVEHRRGEFEREIAKAAQVAQMCPERGRMCWSRLPQLALAHLRSLSPPRLALSSRNTAVEGSSAKTAGGLGRAAGQSVGHL
jgi:hypothetical protein